jgi:hypothetical protein
METKSSEEKSIKETRQTKASKGLSLYYTNIN